MSGFEQKGVKRANGEDVTKGNPKAEHEKPEQAETTAQVAEGPERLLPEFSITDLPSRGLPYPEGFEIKYRPYTYGEVKKSSGSKLSPRARLDLVLEGIDTKGFDKNELSSFDFLFIALHRKISTEGTEKIKVVYQCNQGHIGNSIIPSDSIEYDDISKEVPKLPVIIELGGKDCHFSVLTVKDYMELITLGKHDDPLSILAKQCINRDFKEVYDLIYNATPEEGKLIDEVDTLLYHSVKPRLFRCEECDRLIDEQIAQLNLEEDAVAISELRKQRANNTVRVRLDGMEAIILPFRERDEPVKDRIRFGS